jgi:beta-glucosidase
MSQKLVNILEGITSRVSAGTTVDYRMGALEYWESVNPIDWVTGGAREAEATIAVMGISQLLEGEEGESLASPSKGDRLDLNLPENQMKYLRALREGHDKPLVVVLTGGSPITMLELEEIADAIVWAWYPGQEGGNAVADVIFGNRVPSGKLPVTFPVSAEQLPAYEDYSMEGRTYRYMSSKPLYPFGYGLSYCKFGFSGLQMDRTEIPADGTLSVSVDVRNIGKYDAEEVVQLYVSGPGSGKGQPLWSLKNFQRIALAAGESATVTFKVGRDELEQVDDEGRAVIVPGAYTLHLGNGSPGERSGELGVQVLSATFTVDM